MSCNLLVMNKCKLLFNVFSSCVRLIWYMNFNSGNPQLPCTISFSKATTKLIFKLFRAQTSIVPNNSMQYFTISSTHLDKASYFNIYLQTLHKSSYYLSRLHIFHHLWNINSWQPLHSSWQQPTSKTSPFHMAGTILQSSLLNLLFCPL